MAPRVSLRSLLLKIKIYKISQEQFKSGRECGPLFYSLQLGSLDRLMQIKTRQEVPADISQLTDLLVRMENILVLLETSQASASLLSHWKGQLLR